MATPRTPRKSAPRKQTAISAAPPPAGEPQVEVLAGDRRRLKGNMVYIRGRKPGDADVAFQLVDEPPALALLELAAASESSGDGKAQVHALLQFVNSAVPEDHREPFRDHLLNAQPPIGIEE